MINGIEVKQIEQSYLLTTNEGRVVYNNFNDVREFIDMEVDELWDGSPS